MSSHALLEFLFFSALAWGVWTDIRERRVANELVLFLFAVSLFGAALDVSEASLIVNALLGASIGLAIWLPFWIAGLLGAGDVKFYAAGAAWLGPALSWRAAVVAALLGGVMSAAVLVYRHGVSRTIGSIVVSTEHARSIIANADVAGTDAAARTFPYALPMAISLAFAALQPSRLLRLLGA